MPTEAEWAWIAGLFEGEGTIGFGNTNSVTVTVIMTDRDVIEKLDLLLPSSRGVKTEHMAPPRQTRYRWSLYSAEDVKEFFRGAQPWLGMRRSARVREAWERLARLRPYPRTHCPHGHPLDGVTGGQRYCMTCNRLRSQDRRRASVAA